MSEEIKVSVMLAAQGAEYVHGEMLRHFFDDTRFRVTTNAYNWEDLVKNLEALQPALLVVNAAIARTGEALVDLLAGMQRWRGVAIVLLPPEFGHAAGMLMRVSSVRQTFSLPPNWKEVVEAGYAAAISEQARAVAATPLRQAYGGMPGFGGDSSVLRSGSVVTGTRVVAFLSARGGVGRSTVAECLGYELAVRHNVQTILLACDLPPATVLRMQGLRYVPNAMEFFRRPGDGFNAAIQKYERLDIITAPVNSIEYARAVEPVEGQGSPLRNLFMATWTRNYAAVLLDLPAGEQPWTLEGITAANTAVIVARPSIADIAGVVHTLRLLTERMSEKHRIPREAIYLVLNQVHDHTPLTPRGFMDALTSEFKDWTPQVAAVLPRLDELPILQERMMPPTASLDEFSQGIRGLVQHLYPSMRLDTGASARKKTVFNFFR
jgi:MinD-like ATPase involved in chromosome partitioning or flagellar assembly